jgi:hypothetical protein
MLQINAISADKGAVSPNADRALPLSLSANRLKGLKYLVMALGLVALGCYGYVYPPRGHDPVIWQWVSTFAVLASA